LDDPKIAQTALEIGAYGYIIKPFTLNEVLINITNALRRRNLEIQTRLHRENLEQMVQQRTAELKERETTLQHTVQNLQRFTEGIIQAMALTVETRDPYTAGHQRRVADLAYAIAVEMGLTEVKIEGVRMSGVIHDLGKISVPAEILSKTGRITKAEYMIIKTHPQVGYDILKDIEFPWPVGQIVLQHHERMDGSGYPDALSGKDILIEARIMAVADVLEAMASHRPYRPALGIDIALEEIAKNKGVFYDTEVAEACLRIFSEKQFKLE